MQIRIYSDMARFCDVFVIGEINKLLEQYHIQPMYIQKYEANGDLILTNEQNY